jgi:CRISPR-associated protein Csb2
MFALRVTYLMGRVYSARFEDGDEKNEPEWPPHPSRLFSALVAAWGDGGAEEELKPALEWFEESASPMIYAGACSHRKVVDTFVPVNDSARLPEDRPRKPRRFPSATVFPPDVYFVWNDGPSELQTRALDGILKRTSSLGHSASLISIEMTTQIPKENLDVWLPDADDGKRLRVAHPGRLNELVRRYERFQENPNKIHRPSLGRTALYAKQGVLHPDPPQGIFDRMIILRRDAGPRTSLRSTLSITASLRRQMLKLSPQPIPEYLSGHAPGSTPENPLRSENPHLALVPLAFGGRRGTGELLGIASLLPRTLSREEQSVCWSILGRIRELDMPWGKWTVSIADAEEDRRTLLPETWTRSCRTWSTITPFVFDRFPSEPYGEEAERIVREALVRTGLPEPPELGLHYNPWHVGVPKASAFPAAPSRTGKPQRYHCHVRARFDRSVTGPIAVCAGRYYGYGLFRPLLEREEIE